MFRKISEDNINGKLNDKRFYKLPDGYEAEQEQLKRENETLTAEVSQADTEMVNVAKLIAITKKYASIDKLTPEILNGFLDKIIAHERVKQDGRRRHLLFISFLSLSRLTHIQIAEKIKIKKFLKLDDFY